MKMTEQRLAGKKGTSAVHEAHALFISGTSLWFTSRAAVRSSVRPRRAAVAWIQGLLLPFALVLMLGQHHGGLSHWLTQWKTCNKCLIRKRQVWCWSAWKYTTFIQCVELQVRLMCLSALQIKVAALNKTRKNLTQQLWVSLRRSRGQSGLMAIISLLSESSKWFDCPHKSLINVQQWDVRDIKIWYIISPQDCKRVNIRFHNLFRRMWL